jgi:RsiW-degrading membrane proteinase PrsW (M82 family)
MVAILVLTAFFLPYLLYPVEIILPYPHIIEEIAKATLIYFLLNEEEENKKRILYSLLFGLGFALTESIFYIFNIALVGTIGTFFVRLVITIPFHALTCLVIVLPALKNKKMIVLGLPAAMGIHYLYNLAIASLFSY